MHRIIILLLMSFLVSCGAIPEIDIIDDITAPDYVSSSKARKLEIPPDLSELESQDEYVVPGEAKSYKNFKEKEKNKTTKKTVKVIQDPEGMKIVKSGNLRWLVIKKDPETLWPHLQDFWEDMGFRVKVANKRTGLIETEWIKTSDLRTSSDTALDRWLDSMSGFADKRKFRTRLERGVQDGTTEIFLSHRSSFSGASDHNRIKGNRGVDFEIEEVYRIREYQSEGEGEASQTKLDEMKVEDYELNSEILRRLMVKLGATDFDAKEIIKKPQKIIKADLINTDNGKVIQMNDPYDRAWRRLSLALDIIGFVTEDRDRSEGIFYVKYKGIELPSMDEDKDEKGILDSMLFWKDDKDDKDDKDGLSAPAPGEMLNKGDKSSSVWDQVDDENSGKNKIKKVDEKSSDNNKDEKMFSEKSWDEKFPILNLWGSDDEKKPDDEYRYRIRIDPMGDFTKVYVGLPDGSINNTTESQKILSIIYEQLR